MGFFGGGGKIVEGGARLTSSELISYFWFFFMSGPILMKIDHEMRPRECAQTDTDRHTDATSFVICPMLYVIDIGQIIM